MGKMLITLKTGEQLRIECSRLSDDGFSLRLYNSDEDLIAVFDRSEISSCYPVED